MANYKTKWSPADLEALVFKREVEKKKFGQIAQELNQHENTCARRYREIVMARPPEERPVIRRVIPLHEQLGIETYTHMQAVLCSPYDGRYGNGVRSQPVYAHWYRYPITLAKVFQ